MTKQEKADRKELIKFRHQVLLLRSNAEQAAREECTAEEFLEDQKIELSQTEEVLYGG
jgi:hypothetical protein